MAKVIHNVVPEETEVWKRGDILILKKEYKEKVDNPERVVLFLIRTSGYEFQGVELKNGDLDTTWAIECFRKAPEGYTITLAN